MRAGRSGGKKSKATGRNFAGRQHPTWMSHHAELNSEAELIVIAPAQINLEAIRRGQ
jgi:hypothetical protein